MISYDVCSLFTSILLKETIDIAVDLLFKHNTDFKVTKNEFKKFLIPLYQALIFFFDVSSYDQIDSLAIESPLGSVLVNLFMGYHEASWL